ncbi:MAG: hypothetical protein NDJ92_10405 [Thermoanaerobaculia bacterium]|nr:hypothetical protein [Thermoanaerobaculia bacterium]
MTTALTTLLRGMIDYAGLFPPAALSMEEAVANFESYRASPEKWMLGRLIVPVARLDEFESAAARFSIGLGAGWRISALPGADLRAELEAIDAFNRRNRRRAAVDTIEVKVATSGGIVAASALIPASLETYFEVPVVDDPDWLVEAIATVGRRAKIRTGGVTPDAFPSAAQIARFIARCNSRGVAFKATAGLHHPLRCVRPLTYEPASPTGTMHGFLNVFLAAALVFNGYPVALAEQLLCEDDPASLRVEPDSVAWRGHSLTTVELAASRRRLASSFGSCSFAEPVAEIAELGFGSGTS